MAKRPKLVPAILASSTEELLAQARRVAPLTDLLSYDVADGELVGARTPKPEEYPRLPDGKQIFWHLMVHEPTEYLGACLEAPTAFVALHLEARGLQEALTYLAEQGISTGLVLSPRTPATALTPYLDAIQFAQVMTVDLGAQGQSFQPVQLQKLRELRSLAPGLELAVDGGVSSATIESILRYRPDYLVVGSALTRSETPSDSWQTLNRLIDIGIQ